MSQTFFWGQPARWWGESQRANSKTTQSCPGGRRCWSGVFVFQRQHRNRVLKTPPPFHQDAHAPSLIYRCNHQTESLFLLQGHLRGKNQRRDDRHAKKCDNVLHRRGPFQTRDRTWQKKWHQVSGSSTPPVSPAQQLKHGAPMVNAICVSVHVGV